MKWLTAALTVAVLLLQYRVWLSENGVREVERLERAVATQRADNEQLAERNRQLAAEVRDLKTGMDALEERARSDLGMIARNETFYQVVPARPADPHRSPTRTAAAHWARGALSSPKCATGSSCRPRARAGASGAVSAGR